MAGNSPERAGELFDSGLYRAENVVLAMAEARGIRSPLFPRAATGFCKRHGAHRGNVRRAQRRPSGGRPRGGRDAGGESVEPVYSFGRSLTASFDARFGSTSCPAPTECDLGTADGRRTYYEEEHPVERCRRFVEGAVRIAEEVLAGTS